MTEGMNRDRPNVRIGPRIVPDMIAAGIVTFQPDIERLRENVDGIYSQVAQVIVFDNGSRNVAELERLLSGYERANLVRSENNIGIAGALNRLAALASADGYRWLVTLDQDSVASSGMVDELSAVARSHDGALVTPYIVDINKMSMDGYHRLSLPPVDRYTQPARRGAITSGSLTSLEAIAEVGGFDEHFFIDYVDYDLNQRLLLAGKNLLRANHTFLLHEVGNARETWLRVPRRGLAGEWRLERFYSFGHSPQRCYFKARNRILFTRKYWRQIGISHEGVWQLPQQIALTLLFERDRRAKLRAFLRGIRDGLR